MKTILCMINGQPYYAGDSFMGKPVEYWIKREDEALKSLEEGKRLFRISMSALTLLIIIFVGWIFTL